MYNEVYKLKFYLFIIEGQLEQWAQTSPFNYLGSDDENTKHEERKKEESIVES